MSYFVNKLNKVRERAGKRSKPNVIWLNETPDDTKISFCDFNLKNGIPSMSRSLTDFEKGIACLAGQPNCGKSTIFTNMMLQGLENNDDLIVVDLSLDDSLDKRYQQYMCALTGLYYQDITSNTNLTDTQLLLRKGADKLIDSYYNEGRLFTLESSEPLGPNGTYISFRKLENVFVKFYELRSKYPDKKIAFFVDAWNNFDLSAGKGGTDLAQSNYYLNQLAEEANKHEIMVFLSAHLRKTNEKSYGLEDIKGTSDMAYHVVWAGILRNDHREGHKNPIPWEHNFKEYPSVRIENVKNKVSTWEMDLHYGLKMGQCQLIVPTEQEYISIKDKIKARK